MTCYRGVGHESATKMERIVPRLEQLRLGDYDEFLCAGLSAGRAARASLAQSLCDSLGKHDYRTWKDAMRVVDEFCQRHSLDLPTLGIVLSWSVVGRAVQTVVLMACAVLVTAWLPSVAKLFIVVGFLGWLCLRR
jgi:hypothetical protein